MPSLPPLPDRLKSDARRQLVQRCMGVILKVVNDCAERGFLCKLQNYGGQHGTWNTWHLYPVLARCELDTKERYKFFACSRQRACPIGSGPRKGRSLFRQCTPHALRTDIQLKRTVASRESGSLAKYASNSLLRRGIHPTIGCPAVLQDCKDAIIYWPHRMFAGLCSYDVLHTLYINTIGYLLEAIVSLLTPSVAKKLDNVAALLTPLRNKKTGKTARRMSRVSNNNIATNYINTHYQHTRSTRTNNILYQHATSTHPINTVCQ